MGTITNKEFKERFQKFREKMAESNLDALVIYSWKRGQTKYISGYFPNYVANTAAVLITCQHDPKLYIRFPFDLERAKLVTWIRDIHASGSNEGIAQDISKDLMQMGDQIRKIGLIGGDKAMDEVPYSFVAILEKAFPNAELIDAREMVGAFRLIKSVDEIAMIRKSAKIADHAILHAREFIKPGISEMEIVAEAENDVRKNGGSQHLIVIAAPGNTNLIRPATMRKIKAGEDIILEAAVEADGYWSQIAATFYCGNTTSTQKEIVEAVFDTYKKIVASIITPGIRCSDVAQEAMEYLNKLGYGKYIEQDFGHGIGLDLPEPPKIELDDHTIIKEGMILVIHPAVRIKGIGSAFIGGTIVINRSGVEELHNIDLTLNK